MKDSLLDFILEKPSTAAVAASFGFRPQVKGLTAGGEFRYGSIMKQRILLACLSYPPMQIG